MKLIIQIPCLNEEKSLPATLADLPTHIEGIQKIETLIINDGSSDRTVEVAKKHGVDHVVNFTQRRGLARAFMAGLDACLLHGADIIVNTDADNQYYGPDIAKLVKPILDGEADMVIGDRQTDTITHFSFVKKKLEKIGSWIVRQLSNTTVPDAPSGFRAFSREAALKMNVISKFSYTLETLIQAGQKGLAVVSVPIKTNAKLRESRLFTNIFTFLKHSGSTIVRVYTTHQPLKIFFYTGLFVFCLGLLFGIRFLYYWIIGDGGGHIQSVILSSTLIIMGFFLFFIGLISDLISANRKMIEDVLYRVKKLENNEDKD